jgi:hypothetical protein
MCTLFSLSFFLACQQISYSIALLAYTMKIPQSQIFNEILLKFHFIFISTTSILIMNSGSLLCATSPISIFCSLYGSILNHMDFRKLHSRNMQSKPVKSVKND